MSELIWVAGHGGMVGSAVLSALQDQGRKTITADRNQLDLRVQSDVRNWLASVRPTAIIFAAAKVGGILANDTLPASFIYDNICMQTNVIHAAHQADVNRLIFLGSSCIYPKFAEQPISEASLLTGPLEPTNEWYAIAKIAGIKMCQAYMKQYGRDYVSVMPCNLYGPRDNFDLTSSHVLPALIRKFTAAKRNGSQEVIIWGSGEPLREFLHVEDMATGVIHCLDVYHDYNHINCGSGEEVSIKSLAEKVGAAVGFDGKLVFDKSKPDGTPRKVMDSTRIRSAGWKPSISLDEGIKKTLAWFEKEHNDI